MARFWLARAAQRDLQDITAYLAQDNVEAAERVLVALERTFLDLADRPCSGHTREDLTDEDLRFWPVLHYLVVYDPNRSPIRVARVLHGRRDVRREIDSPRP